MKRVVKVVVFVASTPDFTGQPQVANGASELLGKVFGDAGVHARSAVGVAALPLDAPVEVEISSVAEAREDPAPSGPAAGAPGRGRARVRRRAPRRRSSRATPRP